MSNKDGPENAAYEGMPRRKPISKSQYENLAAFRFALRKFLRFSEDAAGGAGLTPQQHQALLAIKAHAKDQMTIGELARQLLTKNHSAGELVNRLMKAGLVKRSPGTIDRRRVLVSLTRSGEGLLASLSQNNFRELQYIAPAFSGLVAQLERLAALQAASRVAPD
jgi:DNA-binding MarR family transcriptional regulator